MGRFKLIYFDGLGRGETIRLIFAAGGIEFEDHRITFEQWPEYKPKMPTGMVPVLEVDGKMITESTAIARFVAREAGLAGKTSYDQAVVDAVVDTITPARDVAFDYYFAKDDKKAEVKKTFQEKAKAALDLIEKKHKHNNDGKGFLQGDNLTWADLHFLTCIDAMKTVDADVLKPYPTLQALYKKVSEVPKVAAYLKARKDQPI